MLGRLGKIFAAALVLGNLLLFVGVTSPTPAVAGSNCDPDTDPYCQCFGDPQLGDLWCEGWSIPVEVDCFRDHHCNSPE